MKKLFFNLLICSTCLCIFSCEKADIQKNISSPKEIKERGGCVDECQDCDPVDDCCCSITLLSDPGVSPAVLEFCGTSSPCLSLVECERESVGTCNNITGLVEDITLLTQFSTAGFCVPKNASFGIISSNGQHTVRITCQSGQSSPQTVTVTLNTPPDKPYWETNGDCELIGCF